MNYEEFATYWAYNEDHFRAYASAKLALSPITEDDIDDVLATARAAVEDELQEASQATIYTAIDRACKRLIPEPNYETWAIIKLLWECDQAGRYDGGTLEEVAEFLRGYHLENLQDEEPYSPVVTRLDLTAVDWRQVAFSVS